MRLCLHPDDYPEILFNPRLVTIIPILIDVKIKTVDKCPL